MAYELTNSAGSFCLCRKHKPNCAGDVGSGVACLSTQTSQLHSIAHITMQQFLSCAALQVFNQAKQQFIFAHCCTTAVRRQLKAL
jgi:hypothetical protein